MLLLESVRWTSTINLGAVIIGVLLAVAGAMTYLYGSKWKANYEVEKATAESLREGREAYQLRAERLEAEVRECRAEAQEQRELKHSLSAELSAEKKIRDLVPVLKGITDTQQILVEAMGQSREEGVAELKIALGDQEQRALDRHEHIVETLKEIRTSLINNTNGGH
jgi:hypothetical protein